MWLCCLGAGQIICYSINMINYLIIAAVAATFLVVLVGLITMARGGEFNRKYSNKLMRLRLVMQAITVLLLLAALGLGLGTS